MLNSQDYQAVLSFIQEMPSRSSAFPRDLLSLFERRFQVSTSLMIYYQQETGRPNKRSLRYNYIIRNLDPEQIRPYFNEWYQYDCFNEIKQKRWGTVVSLTRLLGEEERRENLYCRYLHSIGLAYQACIFLRNGKDHLGTISLFRTEKEGDFSPRELELYEAVEPFITQRYLQMVENNVFMSLPTHFNEYFSDLDIGVALLDNNGRILKANRCFSEYSSYIYEHGTIEDDIVTRGTVDISADYVDGQKLLNYFGSKLFQRPERIRIECLLYKFKLYTQAVYSQSRNSINAVEYLYLVFLVRQEKISSAEMLDALKLLTPREMTLLGCLASGMSNAQIADKMTISPYTVKTHLQNTYSKCNVSSRNDLLAKLK